MKYILLLLLLLNPPVAENNAEMLVNNLRQEHSLTRLNSSEKLRQSACAKAQHMIDKQYWAHIAPDGTKPWFFFKQAGYSYTHAGENLSRGYPTDEATVDGWLNSPTHKKNMLNDFKDQGICSKSGQYLGEQTTITVQHLGK